jgi:RNA polymerase sigma-70 factor (ECF subfamily)
MSEEVSAEQVLARVARRDLAALSELYDRFAPRVYGLIAHILPSRDDAESVLQQEFVRLWTESARLSQEGGSVEAWLVVTAREAAIRKLRGLHNSEANGGPQALRPSAVKGQHSGGRKPKTAGVPSGASKSLGGNAAAGNAQTRSGAATAGTGRVQSAWVPQPREITLIDDRLNLLHKVINQLPKPQREALELAVFAGLSETEIAAQTGEPLGKVQRSLRAAVTFVKHRRRAVCGTWAANI